MNETVKLCCCPRGGCEAHPDGALNESQDEAEAWRRHAELAEAVAVSFHQENKAVIEQLVKLLHEAEYVRDFNDKAGNWPMVHRAKGKCVAYREALRLLGHRVES